MNTFIRFILLIAIIQFSCTENRSKSSGEAQVAKISDPLPSWNEGDNKSRILQFVEQATDTASSGFIPVKDRIAVFDNDGALWAEQPYYFQLVYAIDFIKKEWSNHPEWEKDPVLKAANIGDIPGILAGGEKGLLEIIMKSHAGMSAKEFDQNVNDWLKISKHPVTGRPYTEMIYQPMLELIDFLKLSGFKTFIVSGGGIDFLRVWAEEVYGIPPYQIVGSSIKARYGEYQGEKTIVKLPEVNFIDDGPGKPVGIHQHIGKKPVIAVGNSDGDFEMLEYTTLGSGPRLGILIHHTDSVREFAYDKDSHIGKLKRGLEDAPSRGWMLVDMSKDWKEIFPESKSQ
jgi:hypothetical protein